MQNMLTMQTNSATVIAAVVVGKGGGGGEGSPPTPFPTITAAMFLNPKLITWNC